MLSGKYQGKYAPLGEDFVLQNARKRARRSSSATSSSDTSHPHGEQVSFQPTKEQFVNMSMDEKMTSIFDMMVNFGSITQKFDLINRNLYYSSAVQDVNEDRIRLLEYKSIDHEARMLKNNLLFTGHPEMMSGDDCMSIVNNLLKNNLQLDMSNIHITKAFRVGKRQISRSRGGVRPFHRAILVSFSDPFVTDIIMDKAYLLKNSSYGISRDYPREIREARQELWPDFKNARDKYGKENVKLKFPAALVINGKTVKNLFPDWYEILRGSRNSNIMERIQEKFKRTVEASLASSFSHEPDIMEENPSDSEQEPNVATGGKANIDSTTSNQGNHRRNDVVYTGEPKASSQGGYLLNVHPPLNQLDTNNRTEDGPSPTDKDE
jgi:hypothetical protein